MSSAAVPFIESLPNPFTPMAFLPPSQATQFEIQSYVWTITLGAYVWDLLRNLENDYYLLFKHKIRIPTIVYYISRISTIALLISGTIFGFRYMGSDECQILIVTGSVFLLISGSSTLFLFFLRVRAVLFLRTRTVSIFFALWLLVVGSYSVIPFSITSGNLGPTKLCVVTHIKEISSLSVIMPPLYDSLLFLAITHKILQNNAIGDTSKHRIKTFFTPRLLPRISRTLLKGSQLYYLLTIWGGISNIVIIYFTGRSFLTTTPLIVFIVFQNTMACVVFRQIKIGLIPADGVSDVGSGSLSSESRIGSQSIGSLRYSETAGVTIDELSGPAADAWQDMRDATDADIRRSVELEPNNEPLEMIVHARICPDDNV